MPTRPDIEVRSATAADVRVLVFMHEKVNEVSYSDYRTTERTLANAKKKLEKMMMDDGGLVLVAAHGETGVIIGFIAVDTVVFEPTGERYPRIASLYVDPEFRGRGVASQLKKSIEQELQTRGYEEIVSQVAVSNQRMIDLNQCLGYEIESYVFRKSLVSPSSLLSQAIKESTRPVVVCLCGSTRFVKAFEEANLRETLAGKIVLSIGTTTQPDDELFAGLPGEERNVVVQRLADLHRHKIEMADEVLILNVGGYIGESTRGEIQFARALGKRIRYLEHQD